MKIRFAVVLLLVSTSVMVGVSGAQAASSAVHVHCGQVLTVDTKIANDLLNCPGDGIIIGADGVTLDLNGHTIDGSEEPYDDCQPDCKYSTGVLNLHHDRVVVEHGTIQEFFDGVFVFHAEHAKVRGVRSIDQRHSGVSIYQVAHAAVDHNRITRTPFIGILAGESRDLTITQNTVIDSGDDEKGNAIWVAQSHRFEIGHNVLVHGHWAVQLTESRDAFVHSNGISESDAGIAIDGSDQNIVRDNHLFHVGVGVGVFGNDNQVLTNHVVGGLLNPDGDDYGVSLEGGQRNLIAHNDIRGVLRDGIRADAFEVGTPLLDNKIVGNHVRGAQGDGFSIDTDVAEGAVGRTWLSGNSSWRAGDDGFDVRNADVALTKNLAVHNGGHGIDAVYGVRDGGGNRARGNRTLPQCVNIRCH